jgi:hypothetical protein
MYLSETRTGDNLSSCPERLPRGLQRHISFDLQAHPEIDCST